MNSINKELEALLTAKSSFLQLIFNSENWHFSKSRIKKYYLRDRIVWTIRLLEFKNRYPVEFGKYLVNLCVGKFLRKLSADFSSITDFNQNELNHRDKIQYILETYEFAYHYFGLITFVNNIDKFDDGSVYEKWYNIELAIQSKQSKNWIKDDKNLSGKNWVIQNNPLNDYVDIDINNWKVIRNATSHNDIIYKKNKIFVLRDRVYVDFSEIVNNLFDTLISFVEITVHFHLEQIFRIGIWKYPFLVYNLSNRFSYKYHKIDFKELDFDYIPIIKNKSAIDNFIRGVFSTRDATYNLFYKKKHGRYPIKGQDESDFEIEQLTMGVYLFANLFGKIEIWLALKNNEFQIDKLFDAIKCQIDLNKLEELFEKSIVETLNLAYEIVIIFAEKVFGLQLEESEKGLEIKSFEDDELFGKVQSAIEQVIKRSVKLNASSGVMLTYSFLFITAVYPIKLLSDGLDDILVAKP